MALIAGSYERFIWGFSLKTLASSDETSLTLKPLFSYPAHSAPIRCVAAAGVAAASGGDDDAVRLYDLRSCSELGALIDVGGSVSSLSFFTHPRTPSRPCYLLSASDDGTFRVHDVDPFVCLATVQAHRGPIADLAVHPSGRVALTVGRADAGLALINLIRGRRSFGCRLEKPASIVRYAGDGGDFFVMVTEATVAVHNSEDARIVHKLDAEKKVLCVAPAQGGIVFTGGEDRCITSWDMTSGKAAYRIQDAHATRVKGLVLLNNQSDASNVSTRIASASSDGVIRIWDVRMTANDNYKPTPICEVNTKSRLTCLAGTSIK